jgi:hypothetical protein
MSYSSTPDLENRFTYHAPKGDQVKRYQDIRNACYRAAQTIDDLSPESPEKKKAIHHLEMATMWANAAIARNE